MTSLFGNIGAQNQPQSNSLFGGGGASQNQNPPPGTGLFGSSTAQPQPQQQQSTSLIGNNPTQNQPAQSNSLFGGAQAPNQNQPAQGSGLFGASNAQQPQQQQQSTSLFSNPQPTTAPNLASSLFTQPAPQRSTAERTFTNPQQTHLSALLQSGLGSNPNAFGSLGLTSQNDLAKSRLASVGINANPNEKNVVAQLQTLVRKWDPRSAGTLMQTHLYNAVNAAYAPFYYRNAEEDEAGWEAALQHKPRALEVGGESVSFVPVLVRGFYDLGQRVEYQARIVNDMRARLHEMNNSLDAVMARQRQNLSVRLENARKQHAALSQRCLRLAVKAQVLRFRGYPLDAAEENLRKELLRLEKTVLDPSFAAREEEIWARMVALRERSRWLEEETKRLGGLVEEQRGQQAGIQGVSEEVLVKTKRILSDYDGQLVHLVKELEEVRSEFDEWEGSRQR